MPFLVLGFLLLPTAGLIYYYLPLDRRGSKDGDEEGGREVPLRTLVRNPQILVIAITAMLANSDYAFLEPTLGDHARDNGLADSPDYIGVLFSVASISYTISCPVIGILAQRDRFGPRPIIVTGLLLQVRRCPRPARDDAMDADAARGSARVRAVPSLTRALRRPEPSPP